MPQPILTDPDQVLDIFQSGLIRGTARLPFAPRKEYFYVQHPEQGWRVYLRAACFLHELYKPFQAAKFLVVKGTGGDPAKATWEPPKGQMEGKDTISAEACRTSVVQLLKKTIRREVEEEAKVRIIRDLSHTGLVLQSVEPDFPPNTYFQYHVFSGYVHPVQLEKAFGEFAWIHEHPAQFLLGKSDVREKDALTWYSAGTTKLMGKWSPTLVSMYLKHFKKV